MQVCTRKGLRFESERWAWRCLFSDFTVLLERLAFWIRIRRVDQKKREGWIVRIGQICIFVAAIDSCGANAAFVGCGGEG